MFCVCIMICIYYTNTYVAKYKKQAWVPSWQYSATKMKMLLEIIIIPLVAEVVTAVAAVVAMGTDASRCSIYRAICM